MGLTQIQSEGIGDGEVKASDLENSGVSAGTYGSSSAIPVITVDAKGRITSASTNIINQVGGSNGVDFNDNVKARFGTGNDLQIYHNGSNSLIEDSGTGKLKLVTNNLDIENSSGENMINAVENGAVNLFYDNSKKLETKSNGVDITGELQCDTLDVDGNADINGKLSVNEIDIRDNGASSPLLNIRGDNNGPWALLVGNDNYSSGTHGLACFQDNDGDVHFNLLGSGAYREILFQQNNGSTSSVGIKIDTSRSVDLRYQDSVKLKTKSDGVNITGELECDSLDVDGVGDFTGDVTFRGGVGAVVIAGNSDLRLESGNWTGDATKIQHHGTLLYIQGSSNGIQFRHINGTDRCLIDANGHFRPASNNNYDLGTSIYRWRNIHTNDLNLSNEGSANDVDGTWGNFTIQEGKDDLFLINRRNGKKYKFNLTEVN